MTHAPLHRRLEKLEAVQIRNSEQAGGIGPHGRLVLFLIAHHLGAMRREESVGVGLARALGYACPSEFQNELHGKVGAMEALEFDQRYAEAMRRLLSLRGAGFDDAGNAVALALKSLFYAMPETMRRHSFIADLEAERLFEPIPDALLKDPVEGVIIEPDATCTPHHAVAAHLYRASCYMPIEVAEGKTVQQAAGEYEEELRRG